MKTLIIVTFIFLSNLLFAQDEFIPLNIQKAFENETRSIEGNPGKNYWQNTADYKIKINFDPFEKYIDGTELITYYNNSPDSLDELVIRLYQNFYMKNSARNYRISSESITDGIQIKKLKINDQLINLENRSIAEFTSTNLIIKLVEKISPDSEIELVVDWKYSIPRGYPIRTGVYDSTTFFIAYWYPQIAVYDDVDGWDKIDFNGEQEMYNDFNNYEVEIEVPNKFFIWATGVMQNAKEIFSEKVFAKIINSQTSDNVIRIISKEDYDIGALFLADKNNSIYKFKAEHVPDFAFGCSDHFLWDAVSFSPDKNSNRKVIISAAYNPKSKDFYNVAQIAKESLEYFSTDLPGVPYPYPSFTVFNGGRGGMEFPMIINDDSYKTLAETIGLTSHEAAHSYFPFYMGINEKKYAWMDEGMAVMLPFKFQEQVEGNDPVGRNTKTYEEYSGKETEMPPIIPSYLLRSTSYRVASYSRPGVAYYFLQDFLGGDTFSKALQEYIQRWNGKHPIPNDFFKTFENYLGMDLSWYWKPWFYEKGYPDLGIKSFNLKNNLLEIEVEKVGNMPIPIKISLLKDGESIKEIYNTADVWKSGNTKVKIKIDNPGKFDRIVLGDVKIPDVNKKNNDAVID